LLKNPEKQAVLPVEIIDSIRGALAEDIGSGDVTTDSIVPANASLRGRIVAKQDGVVAGLDIAAAVWRELDERVSFSAPVSDGARVGNRTVLRR